MIYFRNRLHHYLKAPVPLEVTNEPGPNYTKYVLEAVHNNKKHRMPSVVDEKENYHKNADKLFQLEETMKKDINILGLDIYFLVTLSSCIS